MPNSVWGVVEITVPSEHLGYFKEVRDEGGAFTYGSDHLEYYPAESETPEELAADIESEL